MLVPLGTVMVLVSGVGFADETAPREVVCESGCWAGGEDSCPRLAIARSKVETRAIRGVIFVLARNRNAAGGEVRRLLADIWCLLWKLGASI
jgi:hypothetical protein